ncbi:hypothetical protein H4Q26_014193, partial [Puccinia striiformis f. sp. tritici PST-130]
MISLAIAYGKDSPPFVDPLTSDERLDRIIKNVLADQEAELDHKIFFNQSLRDYRSDKR